MNKQEDVVFQIDEGEIFEGTLKEFQEIFFDVKSINDVKEYCDYMNFDFKIVRVLFG
jgi:hypothetical protein